MKYESNLSVDTIRQNTKKGYVGNAQSSQEVSPKEIFDLSEILKKIESEAEIVSLEDDKDSDWLTLPKKPIFNEPLGLFKSQALLIIGIGGSYTGIKAAYDFLDSCMEERSEESDEKELKSLDDTKRKKLFFLGPCLTFETITKTLNQLDKYNTSVLFISKSGNTQEVLSLVKVIEEYMSEVYGEYKNRVYAITENKEGMLYRQFKEKEYTLIEMQNVTGRYSILSNVGIIPFQFLGLNIEALMQGAQDAYLDDLVYKYAAHRYFIHNHLKKDIEAFIVYDESLLSFLEWLKQLFAESEGKEGRGIFPTSLLFPRDLHSFGQYLQDGKPIFFETTLFFDEELSLENFNKQVLRATSRAHSAPQIKIILDQKDEYSLGYLFQFFQQACSIYCKLSKLNPYTNPGVDLYKNLLIKR